MTAACPCCGAPVEADPLDEAMRVLPPLMAEIVQCLSRRKGQATPNRELAGLVYRNDPNGGPQFAEECIRTTIHRFRARLRATGWDICGQGGAGNGYELRAYRSNP